jgi:hypothetical protein
LLPHLLLLRRNRKDAARLATAERSRTSRAEFQFSWNAADGATVSFEVFAFTLDLIPFCLSPFASYLAFASPLSFFFRVDFPKPGFVQATNPAFSASRP